MTCLFSDENDQTEKEKFRRQEREGITRGGEPLRRLEEMGRIPSTSGGVSHREKQGHFTVVLLLCQLSEARTSSVSERFGVECVCSFET